MSRQLRAEWQVENRDRKVLEAGLAEAAAVGWAKITRDGVAKRADVASGSVNVAFGTIGALRDEVMRAAVSQGLEQIVAQGLAAGSEIARNAPPDLKKRALATLN